MERVPMRNVIQKSLFFLASLFLCMIMIPKPAGAMTTESQSDGKMIYRIQNGESAETTMTVGQQGIFTYDLAGLSDFISGSPVTSVEVTSLYSQDTSVLNVNSDGSFTAVAPGETVVYIQGKYGSYGSYFFGRCDVEVTMDMTNVTLEKESIHSIVSSSTYSYETSILIKNIPENVILSEDNTNFSYVSSNGDMSMSVDLDNNQVKMSFYSAGKTTLTLQINGKEFILHVNLEKVTISQRGAVAAKGKKIQLKIKGTKESPKWSSSNPKVAKVTSKGVVSCKRKGNAVITASFGGEKVGCAISVISAKKMKTIQYAKMIGTKWTYSQPKRMQKGYYDCSSLVWKSYCKMGKKIGGNYAPVAADLAKWCKAHGKKIAKSYTRNHIQKMKLNPGDLMYETGANNGRYLGIYHVEMFTGYAVAYYDAQGKPVLNELWAARPEGYYGGGHLVYRPFP